MGHNPCPIPLEALPRLAEPAADCVLEAVPRALVARFPVVAHFRLHGVPVLASAGQVVAVAVGVLIAGVVVPPAILEILAEVRAAGGVDRLEPSGARLSRTCRDGLDVDIGA